MRISFQQACAYLKAGQIIAVPTETVYGLAACLDQPEAIRKIFSLKGRPLVNPLIVHLAQAAEIDFYIESKPKTLDLLTKNYWPGPLTTILSAQTSKIPSHVRAHLPTAGFRVPELAITRQLIEQVGPLVMPSANLSGRPSATRPEHIEEDFGMDFPILDGGFCSRGVESTIVTYLNGQWVILRLGALSPTDFEHTLGYIPIVYEKTIHQAKPLCPGQLFKHYSPQTPLYLEKLKNEALFSHILGFQERDYLFSTPKRVIHLGSIEHPQAVAEHLYQALRLLDKEQASGAWVDMQFPQTGLWLTIAERLIRASQKE